MIAELQVNPSAVLSKALLRVAGHLELSQRKLGQILGISEASVSRLHAGRLIDPQSKEGELALLLIRVYRSLDALMGGDLKALRQWFHAHNHHLQDTPANLVHSVAGIVHVAEYLDAMRGTL